MKVILKKIPLYESFDFDSEEVETFDGVIESHRYKKFLENNYYIEDDLIRPYKKDGLLFIDVDGYVIVKNEKLTSLTEGRFCFGRVKGDFDCSDCKYLKSLKGAPSKVDGVFECRNCESLTSLEGAPEVVGESFDCFNCNSLTSLKGAPREVGGNFNCHGCKSLTSLKGVPREVGGNFNCYGCTSLTSLEGAPEKVGENFYCGYCKSLKSIDIPTITKIKGRIFK